MSLLLFVKRLFIVFIKLFANFLILRLHVEEVLLSGVEVMLVLTTVVAAVTRRLAGRILTISE